MFTRQAKKSVAQLVQEREARADVLDAYGIDYCCGGGTPLAEACAARGISFEEVRRALEQCDRSDDVAAKTDWATESLTDLVEHILAWHHAYLREQLPRLDALLEKVSQRHAPRHPNLAELSQHFFQLRTNLLDHILKEELGVFPRICELDRAVRERRPPAHPCGASLRGPLHSMEEEHRGVGVILRRMRSLAFDYDPPRDACQAYRELLDGLAGLESDLHLHMHKENNLLFPRAARLGAQFTAGRL